jgi:hypothetical protein
MVVSKIRIVFYFGPATKMLFAMKFNHFARWGFTCLIIALGFAGCQTDENHGTGFSGNIKSQGVYTTLAIPDMGLDMPGAGYLSKSTFGPGESPAAVVVGYGSYNQQQSVTLKLVESSTGRTLMSKDYYASYGMALMQPLAIRLSGNYELDLTSGGFKLDTWQFTVTRTNDSGASLVPAGGPGANYGQGIFDVELKGVASLDRFDKYDDKLIYTILNSVTKEAGSTNLDLFAQRFPGEVVIQCRLNFQGRITEPKILENTLDDGCGKAFEKALLDRSPYDPWPEDAHQELGSDNRDLKLIIRYE